MENNKQYLDADNQPPIGSVWELLKSGGGDGCWMQVTGKRNASSFIPCKVVRTAERHSTMGAYVSCHKFSMDMYWKLISLTPAQPDPIIELSRCLAVSPRLFSWDQVPPVHSKGIFK